MTASNAIWATPVLVALTMTCGMIHAYLKELAGAKLMNNMNDFDAATNDSENRRNENSYNENAIEWITGDKTATVTFSNGRFVGKVRKLAAEHPDEVKIVKDYGNGILAHIPVKYIRIGAISRKPMTEAEKEKAREWMKHVRMLNNKAPN